MFLPKAYNDFVNAKYLKWQYEMELRYTDKNIYIKQITSSIHFYILTYKYSLYLCFIIPLTRYI